MVPPLQNVPMKVGLSMIRILTVISILIANMAQAQTVGFADDDGPVVKPPQTTPAPVRPTPPPAPPVVNQPPVQQPPVQQPTPPRPPVVEQPPRPPAEIPNFPKCSEGRSTGNTVTIRKMIKHVLNIDNGFGRRMNGPRSPNGSENSFTLYDGENRELQVRAVKEGAPYMLPGTFCEANGSLIVKLIYSGFGYREFFLKVRPVSTTRILISPIENGREVLTQSAQFTLDSAGGVR
jgi:hypothetical protein